MKPSGHMPPQVGYVAPPHGVGSVVLVDEVVVDDVLGKVSVVDRHEPSVCGFATLKNVALLVTWPFPVAKLTL